METQNKPRLEIARCEKNDSLKQHYESGQHAAIRGLYRILVCSASKEHAEQWYKGYDSVPSHLRGRAPKTGRVDASLLEQIKKAKSQGPALDEIRIRIFDSMPEWAQRDIVEQVLAEVKASRSAIPSECRAIIV